MPNSLVFAAHCTAIIAAFMVIGNLIEDKIDPKFRENISNTVFQNLRKDKRLELSKYFILLFDIVFNTNQKGRPSFIRSVLVSIFVLIAMLTSWVLSNRFDLGDTLVHDSSFLLLVGISVLSTNLLGDFFSLWETRTVIMNMKETDSVGRFVNWIILDFVLTYFLYIGAILCAAIVFFTLTSIFPVTGPTVSTSRSVVTFVMLAGGFVIFTPDRSALDVFSFVFFTTMLTSIWLWSFMIGAIISAALGAVRRRVRLLADVINIEQHPIFWIMTVCGVVFSGLVSLPAVVQPMKSLLSNLIASLGS